LATFKTTYRIARVDTNVSGVVHTANYFYLFQRAEEDLYRNIGYNFQEIMDKYNVWIRKVEAFCKFKGPSKFNDLLEIEVAVKEIEEKAVKYGFTIRHKETSVTVAEGYVVEAFEDKRSGKIVNIPSGLAEKLEAFARISVRKHPRSKI